MTETPKNKDKAFKILYEDWLEKVKDLGIPMDSWCERTKVIWFNKHLNDFEKRMLK